MVTKGDLTGRFPEFSTYTDDQLDYAIADATAQVNAAAFGTKTDLAIIYLAAHLAAVGSRGSSGVIQSEKVGDLQRSYAVNASAGDLASTGYGSMYLNLRRSIAMPRVI